VRLGDEVRRGQILGAIGDPFGDNELPVPASHSGFVIGMVDLPLVYEGDALFHIARVDDNGEDGPRGRIELDFPSGDELLPGADDRT